LRLPGVSYDSPLEFSTKQRLILATVPLAVTSLLKLFYLTIRTRVEGAEHRVAATAHGPCILAIWHESLGLAVNEHRGSNYHTIASYSYDGELATRAMRHFGVEAVRGSSSKGGSQALHELEKVLAQGTTVGWTLDGPRGPRRIAKVGVGVLSARSQAPILPIATAVDRAWRLRSWDRFAVPKPFSTVVCAYAPPIPPPSSTDPEEVEAKRLEVESVMNTLHRKIEAETGGIQVDNEVPGETP
jgi:lysophospholipid acyltransferase (LPLAT)-like uncharacterized protein